MSDLLHEQLSALVDGELPPEETGLLLRRIEREPELAARLTRYRLMGEVLRGDTARPSVSFASRISAAVAAEPLPTPSVAPRRRMAFAAVRPVLGFGLAAAVGALAVLVLAHGPRDIEARSSQTATVLPTAATVAPASMDVVLSNTAEPASYVTPAAAPAQLRPISRATLANYVASHARMSGSLGGRDALIHLVADSAPEDAAQP